MVRAKFVVESYETRKSNTRDPESEELRTLKLVAVADGSEENKKFFRWTPNGTINIGILNPEAWKQLELGKSYYVDFTDATPKRFGVMKYPCGCSATGPEDLPTYCAEHGKFGDPGAVFTETPDAPATK